MGIEYRFNEWRISGEKATIWSPKVYQLLRLNASNEDINGFNIGKILYYHHVKGFSPPEVKDVVKGFNLIKIKSILRGFGRHAGYESVQAYNTFMELLRDEPEMLDVVFGN